MFKRALVSTSDKTGLVEFLKPLVDQGMEVVSTGGTSKFLRENKIKVTEVSEVTGFPEVMDGRVRTLHPNIHMGLLARTSMAEDMKLLEEHKVKLFDLVVVNLYPFEESFKKGLEGAELIEQIDIGGPSLLRAASKSFDRIAVVCSPKDYEWIGERARSKNDLTNEERQALAVKVYSHTSFYDSLIARALTKNENFPSEMTLGMRLHSSLRYGENPHQTAAWYKDPLSPLGSLSDCRQLQGKELSYNNILDSEAALQTLKLVSFTPKGPTPPAAVIVKHNTPCGVARGETLEQAFLHALRGDPVSAFGGIVALNDAVDGNLAHQLNKIFLECVIASDFTPEALEILATKKNLRVLKLSTGAASLQLPVKTREVKSIVGGLLVQDSDLTPTTDFSSFKVLGEMPDQSVQDDMVFLFNVVRMVKSNAIVVGRSLQTLGLCGGQTNRIDAARMALERASQIDKDNSGLIKRDWVLASDAFFPFRDSIDLAAKYGVRWVIQPGGSMRDAEVEQAAREHGITMVLTGKRHFKH